MVFPEGILRTTTYSGTSVIIYTMTAGGDRPIHGAYLGDSKQNVWIPCAWTSSGKLQEGRRSSLDIILVEEKARQI